MRTMVRFDVKLKDSKCADEVRIALENIKGIRVVTTASPDIDTGDGVMLGEVKGYSAEVIGELSRINNDIIRLGHQFYNEIERPEIIEIEKEWKLALKESVTYIRKELATFIAPKEEQNERKKTNIHKVRSSGTKTGRSESDNSA